MAETNRPAEPPENTIGWLSALSGFRSRRFLAFLLLGIAAGAPVATAWDWMAGQPAAGAFTAGVAAATGLLTMVIVARLILGPWLDMAPPFGFRRLGRRRGWTLLLILFAIPFQIGIGMSTPGIAPISGLFLAFIGGALLATIDAWRSEAAEPRAQGILAAGQWIGAFAPSIAVNAGTILIGVDAATVSAVGGVIALIVGVMALPVVGQRTQSDACPDPTQFPPVRRFLASDPNLSKIGSQITARLYGAIVCPISSWFARLGPVAPVVLIFLVVDGVAQTGGVRNLTPLLTGESFSMERLAVLTSARAFSPLALIVGAIVGAVFVARLSARRALPWAPLSGLFAHVVTLAAMQAMPDLRIYVVAEFLLSFLEGFGFIVWLAWLVTVTVRPFTGWQLTILGLVVASVDQLVPLAAWSAGALGGGGAEILFAILSAVGLAIAFWLVRNGPSAPREAFPESAGDRSASD